MNLGVSPLKTSTRMAEDMVLGDSVSGVSRSGRVRKKSAKLMEMEDFHSPFYDGDYSTEGQRNKKKLPIKIVSPPMSSSGTSHSSQFNVVASETKINHASLPKRKPGLLQSGALGLASLKQSMITSTPIQKGERVIAIKQMEPPTQTFEALSGSAYLMGDDIHFITGEAVDSGNEVNDGTDNEAQLSPLKIDVGGSDEHSVSVHEESGLKMKFILSPKSSKVEPAGKVCSGSQKRKGNILPSRAGSSSKRSSNVPSNRAKKKSRPSASSLEVLASGGMLHDDDETASLSIDSSDEDIIRDSKLIIAEPPPPHQHLMNKSKRFSMKDSDRIGSGLKSKRKPPSKSLARVDSLLDDHDLIPSEVSVQQQSLYLKEKISNKKKSSKKAVKQIGKEAGLQVEKKARPVSAYMVWCKESRPRLVSDHPNLDFASISRRLGEMWKALPDGEKLNWRRKAKNISAKTGLLIKTGGKMLESDKTKTLIKQPNVKTEELPCVLKESHRASGTSPLDVAAYLKLLGESLSIIGQRLTEHEGQIAVSGSLSVLLDSTLCALGPLLCLTSEVKQLDGCDKATQEVILDNIAYIMPGL